MGKRSGWGKFEPLPIPTNGCLFTHWFPLISAHPKWGWNHQQLLWINYDNSSSWNEKSEDSGKKNSIYRWKTTKFQHSKSNQGSNKNWLGSHAMGLWRWVWCWNRVPAASPEQVFKDKFQVVSMNPVPSGKRLHNYGKIHHFVAG